MFRITRRYHFEAAHFLPKVHEMHKCRNMHGHNYEFEVTVRSNTIVDGFVIDYWDLDKIVHPLIEKVDHRLLNHIDGLDNPTAELIAEWLLGHLREELRKLAQTPTYFRDMQFEKVQVWETKDCSAIAE